MHCSDEQLLRDSRDVREHLDSCTSCQSRLLLLKRLEEDARNLAIYQPSDFAWLKVKASVPQQKKRRSYMFPLSIAASVIVSVILTLIINSKWKDFNVEQLVAKSNAYEQQLVLRKIPSVLVGNNLWKIAQIDIQLNLKQSKSAQQELWQKRNETLKKILAVTSNAEVI